MALNCCPNKSNNLEYLRPEDTYYRQNLAIKTYCHFCIVSRSGGLKMTINFLTLRRHCNGINESNSPFIAIKGGINSMKMLFVCLRTLTKLLFACFETFGINWTSHWHKRVPFTSDINRLKNVISVCWNITGVVICRSTLS